MKTISFGLSQKSIQNAIKELQKLKQELRKKTDQLVKELTEVGIPVIENNMQKANYTYDSKGVRSVLTQNIIRT